MTPPGGFSRRTTTQTFRNRREAGRALAAELMPYRDKQTLVVGLARGGVPVAWEVAAALRAPLDVFLVRKLGVPRWPELAMGALVSGGGLVMNDHVVSGLEVSDDQVRQVIDSETVELGRRERAYRGDRPPADPHGKTTILVDDGIATGASMLASIRAVRAAGPESIVVAVPVGPRSTLDELRRVADDIVCVNIPTEFDAVGQVYADFRQVADDEVRELLNTPTR